MYNQKKKILTDEDKNNEIRVANTIAESFKKKKNVWHLIEIQQQ